MAALGVLAGCAGRPLPPIDLSEPGWQVRETQVVWRPRRSGPELAGELLVAGHPDGRHLVQFSKQALPIITAQSDSQGWNISSSLRHNRFGGTLPPTDRVPWFHLEKWPPSPPAGSRWRWEENTNGTWRLSNSVTGEFVEGSTP